MSSKIGDLLFRQRLKSKLGNVFVYFSRFGQIDKSRTKRGSFFWAESWAVFYQARNYVRRIGNGFHNMCDLL